MEIPAPTRRGDKGDDVLRAVIQNAGIIHADLTDRIYLIAAGAELGGQLDGVANVKGVNFAKVIVDAPIMARNRHIAFPNGGAGKMSCALAECVRVRPLIHLDRQAEGGNFQRTEVATAVIEVFRDRGVLYRRVGACAAVGTAGSGGRMLAAFSMPASALEYHFDGPDAGLFGRPTSDETIYVTMDKPVNTDQSKNAAYIPPAFGSPTSYTILSN